MFVFPFGDPGVGRRQKGAHEHPDGLNDRAVRQIALKLVKLAFDKIPAVFHNARRHFANQSGLADAGISAHESQNATARGRSFKFSEQRLEFRVASEEPPREIIPFGVIRGSRVERLDRAVETHLAQAFLEVVRQTVQTAVTIVGGFRQQSQQDV